MGKMENWKRGVKISYGCKHVRWLRIWLFFYFSILIEFHLCSSAKHINNVGQILFSSSGALSLSLNTYWTLLMWDVASNIIVCYISVLRQRCFGWMVWFRQHIYSWCCECNLIKWCLSSNFPISVENCHLNVCNHGWVSCLKGKRKVVDLLWLNFICSTCYNAFLTTECDLRLRNALFLCTVLILWCSF